MEAIVQNFDGLNFLVVAKSGYDPKVIETVNAQFLTGNDPIYFAAHFPLFPILIKFFELVWQSDKALLGVIVVSNLLMAGGLYGFFATVLRNKNLAMILSAVALFFPARMLSVRGVGSNEPIFIFFILLSLTWAMKQRYWPSALAGTLAVLTRSPGILLFFVYLWSMVNGQWSIKKFIPYLMMPLALLGLFAFYGYQYGDPLAYFHSGDNLHLFFPPFTIFSNMTTWISDMWREDVIYLYIYYGIGISMVNERWSMIKKFGIIYGGVLLFVAHRDLARYALPLSPIALLGYAPLLEKIPRKMWWVGAILIIPIYLLGWQFILKNIQPISNWGALL